MQTNGDQIVKEVNQFLLNSACDSLLHHLGQMDLFDQMSRSTHDPQHNISLRELSRRSRRNATRRSRDVERYLDLGA